MIGANTKDEVVSLYTFKTKKDGFMKGEGQKTWQEFAVKVTEEERKEEADRVEKHAGWRKNGDFQRC